MTPREQSEEDRWIMKHSAEIKQELIRWANSKKHKPAPHTLLGRALYLFTTTQPNSEFEPEIDEWRSPEYE